METYDKSQANNLNGTELPGLILLQVDSLVRAIVQPENAKEKLMIGTCGLKWHESFAKLNHNGWSRKMFEEFSLWTGESYSETFSETWPKWGIVLDGVAGGANAVGAPHRRERIFILAHSQQFEYCQRHSGDFQRGRERQAQQIRAGSSSSTKLMWPTPCASNFKTPCEHGQGGRNLQTEVKLWATPSAQDCQGSHGGGQHSSLRTDIYNVKKKTGETGQLNPDWVECLMNFPIGWTNPECENPIEWPGWPAFRGQKQYTYEPPRIATSNKYREKRIKACGNAVLPLQAVPIFAAITKIRNQGNKGAG
ncbi:hypothetical protein M7775_18185 [Sporomusa sphaeroides DSM 2875]|nr:hypothetical protein [Sporomusa sphaeroides]MCM0760486.1 hypothetical protein [Sporomusa sphaeroides DSM 2875]